MQDINMKKNLFHSELDQELTAFVNLELGYEYEVYRVFNEKNHLVQWSLINILERKDIANSENREEFVHLINTIGNFKNDTKEIRRFDARA